MTINNLKPTERFSNRVENYFKYRPSYPEEVSEYLIKMYGLTRTAKVADIGSGTGLLSEIFLRKGLSVTGVEPNTPMRLAGDQFLTDYPGFESVDGVAENTGLCDQSVDMIVAGQAFHWFQADATKREFKRILKPGGHVGLIWNRRSLESAFLQEYEDLLLRYAPAYENIINSHIQQGVIEEFFSPKQVSEKHFENVQLMDFTGFRGRLESASYCPTENEDNYQPLIESLRALFDKYQKNNRVSFDYDTVVFSG